MKGCATIVSQVLLARLFCQAAERKMQKDSSWMGDVEIPPPGFPVVGFGITLRFYGPAIDAWQCTWVDPVSHVLQKLVARKIGNEIVLKTKTKKGYPERWIYSEITLRSS